MSDTTVTIGANATQYEQVMAKVRATAKATGDTIGVELGDRKGFRQEMRMERGLNAFIKSLFSAKDPIAAVSGALEGLSRAFMATGAVLVAVGVIGELWEQLVKAKEGSDKLCESITKLGSADADNESVHQLQRDVDDFQKVQEKYDQRGLLEKIFFGGREDSLMKAAASLNELKKSLIEIEQLKQDDVKFQARALEASDNPADKARGKQLLKTLSDTAEASDLQDKLNDALKTQSDLQEKADVAASNARNRRNRGLRFSGGGAEGQAIIDQAQRDADAAAAALKKQGEVVAQIRRDQADQTTTQQTEAASVDLEEGDKARKTELDKIHEAETKKNELTQEMAMEGLTDTQKIAALKAKIRDDQDKADAFVGPRLESQILTEQNQLLASKFELTKLIHAEEQRQQRKALTPAQMDARQEAEAAHRDRRAELLKQIAEARSGLSTAQAEGMTFHGQVSASRRDGFGRAPAAGTHEMQALKATRDAVDRLDKAVRELKQLNDKIGGAA